MVLPPTASLAEEAPSTTAQLPLRTGTVKQIISVERSRCHHHCSQGFKFLAPRFLRQSHRVILTREQYHG